MRIEKVDEKFKKCYYSKLEPINGEELEFARRIDSEMLPNVEYWMRNREKDDPFYIQDRKSGKFYPDFVVKTTKGNIVALEWKGQNVLTNEDTSYKEGLKNLGGAR